MRDILRTTFLFITDAFVVVLLIMLLTGPY